MIGNYEKSRLMCDERSGWKALIDNLEKSMCGGRNGWKVLIDNLEKSSLMCGVTKGWKVVIDNFGKKLSLMCGRWTHALVREAVPYQIQFPKLLILFFSQDLVETSSLSWQCF